MRTFFVATLVLGCASVAQGQAVPGAIGGSATNAAAWPDRFETIRNDFNSVDVDGNRILTRSGGLAQFDGKFYWYGGDPRGFRAQYCYSSDDLVNWKNEGAILRHDVECNRIEVLYNDATRQYVMFIKYHGNGARLGIATADKPVGPFTFRGDTLVDGARIGDMSVFKDDDGAAYLCYVSWAKGTNAQHGIYKMSADYLKPEKRVFLWDVGAREAPHLFKRNGLYYYGTSDTAWIDSSGTRYYTAKDLAGPWSAAKPLETPGSRNSWDSQCDFVFPIQGAEGTIYLYVGDRWLRDEPAGRNGHFVWLPMEFDGDRPVLRYQQDWELNLKRGTWRPFDASRDLAAGKPATASSAVGEHVAGDVTKPTTFADYAGLHWDSEASDPQWIGVDLGTATDVNRVVLKWNKSAAKRYTIQTSLDGNAWDDVFATAAGSANVVADARFPTRKARYVRMYGTERAPVQVETRRQVRGDPAAATRPATRPTTQPPPRYSLFRFSVFHD